MTLSTSLWATILWLVVFAVWRKFFLYLLTIPLKWLIVGFCGLGTVMTTTAFWFLTLQVRIIRYCFPEHLKTRL